MSGSWRGKYALTAYIVAPMSTSSPLDRWGDRLPRRLGLWSAVAVVIGSTIGSGIFRTPASIAHRVDDRSEEHTSELQSLAYLVCRLLLEKKKKKRKQPHTQVNQPQSASSSDS